MFSEYTKQRILFFHQQGLLSTSIKKELEKDGITASVVGILKFLRRYEQHGTIQRLPGSGRCSIVTPSTEATIESRMEDDDEKTTVTNTLSVKRSFVVPVRNSAKSCPYGMDF